MKRTDFHFDLPTGLIAQHPTPDRDGARLLVVDAQTGIWFHRTIRDLPDLVPARSICVPNDVRVRHARLFLRRRGGGAGEALLLRSLGGGIFEALVRPGARLKPGASAAVVDPDSLVELARIDVLGALPEGLRTVRIHADHGLDWDEIDRIGRLPLPPYIEHLANTEDETRYQTVFAALEPVLKDRSRPVFCVGTTSLRTLEGAWTGSSLLREGATRLFITPGYRLRTANHLLTNFHLPESTLFVLVAALLGLDLAQAAYAEAVRERYRFFSYGDAMLILNARPTHS